ncbi:MAG: heavy-metal-associated domain-containing protein [Anaerolineae bacterium]|jgi:copper chaperone CopZ|nr:heavy-metal-associated domain-containing protein [Anaerolineae bacterium]
MSEKVTLAIPDMHCANCVMRLESLEDDLPGVVSITASYRSQKMEIEYDPAGVTIDQIMAAVSRLGYHPERR